MKSQRPYRRGCSRLVPRGSRGLALRPLGAVRLARDLDDQVEEVVFAVAVVERR